MSIETESELNHQATRTAKVAKENKMQIYRGNKSDSGDKSLGSVSRSKLQLDSSVSVSYTHLTLPTILLV